MPKKQRKNSVPKELIGHEWKPGQTGNPNGRPKGVRNRATIAKRVLEMRGLLPEQVFEKLKKMFPEMGKHLDVEEISWLMQANKAITKGDLGALLALMDSAYGKANQGITGKDGGAIQVDVKNVHDMTSEEIQAELAKEGYVPKEE